MTRALMGFLLPTNCIIPLCLQIAFSLLPFVEIKVTLPSDPTLSGLLRPVAQWFSARLRCRNECAAGSQWFEPQSRQEIFRLV
jgi:hypothetical protein